MLEDMKQLKTSLKSFRELFEKSIPVVQLAEALVSFDEDSDPALAKAYAEERGYDIVGVRRQDQLIGTVVVANLEGGKLKDALVPFEPIDVIDGQSSMLEVYRRMKRRSFLLVSDSGSGWGIVTPGDLQKMPSRIWLFGIVSLVEMHAIRLLKQSGPDPSQWEQIIGTKQFEKCQKSHERLKRLNLDLELVDSLQLADEFDLLRHDITRVTELGFSSASNLRSFVKDLSGLRNTLAHSRAMGRKQLDCLPDLMEKAEQFIRIAESIQLTGTVEAAPARASIEHSGAKVKSAQCMANIGLFEGVILWNKCKE